MADKRTNSRIRRAASLSVRVAIVTICVASHLSAAVPPVRAPGTRASERSAAMPLVKDAVTIPPPAATGAVILRHWVEGQPEAMKWCGAGTPPSLVGVVHLGDPKVLQVEEVEIGSLGQRKVTTVARVAIEAQGLKIGRAHV